MSSRIASSQTEPWATPSRREATTSRPTPIALLIASPTTDLRRLGIVAAGEQEEGDLARPDDGVGDGEGEGEVVERLRDAERDHQQPGHRAEDREADGPLLGVDDAGQPGVADPGPPQHAEHEDPLRQARPGRIVRHQRGALGDGEHEDEVEEELERGDLLAVTQRRAEAAVACCGALQGRIHPGNSEFWGCSGPASCRYPDNDPDSSHPDLLTPRRRRGRPARGSGGLGRREEAAARPDRLLQGRGPNLGPPRDGRQGHRQVPPPHQGDLRRSQDLRQHPARGRRPGGRPLRLPPGRPARLDSVRLQRRRAACHPEAFRGDRLLP